MKQFFVNILFVWACINESIAVAIFAFLLSCKFYKFNLFLCLDTKFSKSQISNDWKPVCWAHVRAYIVISCILFLSLFIYLCIFLTYDRWLLGRICLFIFKHLYILHIHIPCTQKIEKNNLKKFNGEQSDDIQSVSRARVLGKIVSA